MIDTEIKWFSSENIGAPQLSNTWGCMIGVLDACLLTGFGSQLVSSLVIKNGVGVATFGGSHNIKQFQVVEFSGASQALDTEHKVLGTTDTTIEFAADLPDQILTGAISCRLAAAKWKKAFSGLNKAVYQAKNTDANPYFLRVDNSLDPVYSTTRAKYSKVGILETCSGVDDLSGNQVPFDPASPTKNWVGTGSGTSAYNGWAKWLNATDATSATSSFQPPSNAVEGERSWILICTDDTFYILPSLTIKTASGNNPLYRLIYGYGVTEDYNIPFLVSTKMYHQVGAGGINYELTTALNGASTTASYERSFLLLEDRLLNYNQAQNNVDFGFGINQPGKTDKFPNPDGSVFCSPIYTNDANGFFAGLLPLIKNPLSDLRGVFLDKPIYSVGDEKYLMCKTAAQTANLGNLFFRVY